MARRAYDAMCERALYRPVKHGLLKDTQTVQAWIADSAAEMHAARLMTLHAAWVMDNHGSSAARTDYGLEILTNGLPDSDLLCRHAHDRSGSYPDR